MPRGDRTGPNSLGQMTGRQMGLCTGFATQANFGGGFGQGRGNGRRLFAGHGGGLGFRNRNSVQVANLNASEQTIIQSNINLLKEQLSSLEERLSKIKNES